MRPRDVSRSVRCEPSPAASGRPGRSGGWRGWCPACTGEPTVSGAPKRPDDAFAQPENSNRLNIGKDRDFEPLTDAFAEDPLLQSLMGVLARVAAALDDVAEWDVKVHPFRVQSVAGSDGRPAPEGWHRDGVTLVSSLLIGRRNALGGQSSVCDVDGRPLLTATLDEPGTLLLGDDRRSLHDVSPIRPIDNSEPAQRDVLVITFASR
ncbi:hypothetical protein C3477_04160 [Mycobacterium kansasii]|nr:hypothetical protein C3B43_02155 [Mycobacterium kansasii]POY08501.1 hypothetical protein C3477_04160 [Mycobacterium kansasii]POY25533.1 hypothetical protein C3476_00040 [Mycobacterium kansasii]